MTSNDRYAGDPEAQAVRDEILAHFPNITSSRLHAAVHDELWDRQVLAAEAERQAKKAHRRYVASLVGWGLGIVWVFACAVYAIHTQHTRDYTEFVTILSVFAVYARVGVVRRARKS